jgi:hypothetical protein
MTPITEHPKKYKYAFGKLGTYKNVLQMKNNPIIAKLNEI